MRLKEIEARLAEIKEELNTRAAELTDEDVDYMLEVIPQVVTYLRNMSPLWEKIKKQEAQEALNK